jgi:hypothetical protein
VCLLFLTFSLLLRMFSFDVASTYCVIRQRSFSIFFLSKRDLCRLAFHSLLSQQRMQFILS